MGAPAHDAHVSPREQTSMLARQTFTTWAFMKVLLKWCLMHWMGSAMQVALPCSAHGFASGIKFCRLEMCGQVTSSSVTQNEQVLSPSWLGRVMLMHEVSDA